MSNLRLQTAYRKGWKAARDGRSEIHCPYGDNRTRHGAITWSRGYIRAWLEGFRDERAGRPGKELQI